MPEKGPLTLLRQVREAAGLSQRDMALYFGFEGRNGRNTVARWENGEGNLPAMKHRSTFISYLAIKLGLRNDRQRFDEVWRTLEKHWNWPTITDREWTDYVVDNDESLGPSKEHRVMPMLIADTYDNGAVQGPALPSTFSAPVNIVVRSEKLQTQEFKHVNWEVLVDRYRHELEEHYGSIQILGMARPIPLDDIFTDVYLLDKPNAWRRHVIEELEKRDILGDGYSIDVPRESGVSFVHKHHRVFIFGKPGAGKTTFLKYLVKQTISGHFSAIPIFISIKKWVDSNQDLEQFIEDQFHSCDFPSVQIFVNALLDQGQALLLFDGLDEVNLEGNARAKITADIRDAVRRYGTKSLS